MRLTILRPATFCSYDRTMANVRYLVGRTAADESDAARCRARSDTIGASFFLLIREAEAMSIARNGPARDEHKNRRSSTLASSARMVIASTIASAAMARHHFADHREISQERRDGGGDYLLMVGNCPSLKGTRERGDERLRRFRRQRSAQHRAHRHDRRDDFDCSGAHRRAAARCLGRWCWL